MLMSACSYADVMASVVFCAAESRGSKKSWQLMLIDSIRRARSVLGGKLMSISWCTFEFKIVQLCWWCSTDCITATWPVSVPFITSGWLSVSGWLLLHHICTCPFILWCNTSSWWHRKPFDYHKAPVRAARAGPATRGGMSGHADGCFFLFWGINVLTRVCLTLNRLFSLSWGFNLT